MPSFERQGATIHYEVLGQGPTLVLGHSLLCDGRMWDPILPGLAARHRVLNVDARGHRHSTAPAAFTLEDLADDWLALLDREQVSRAVLCGLSMGGMTGMRLALRAPERVAGLVLLDTSAARQPWAERLRFRLMAEFVRAFGFRELLFRPVTRALLGRTTLRTRPALVAEVVERIKEQDGRQLYPAVRAVIERRSIVGEIPRIGAPVLVLVGTEDATTPPANARRIAQSIPGARLVEIQGSGHLSTLEAPERVGPAIDAFLAGIVW